MEMINPQWERLHEMMAAIRPQAEMLATAFDKAWRCYPGALNSPEGERVAGEFAGPSSVGGAANAALKGRAVAGNRWIRGISVPASCGSLVRAHFVHCFGVDQGLLVDQSDICAHF